MPIEQVRCENCGSGDVCLLAAESYRCEHCQTNFRWVDPTKSTVVQKPSLCKCGRAVVGACWRCHTPLCGTCGGAAGEFYRSLADLFRHLPRSLCQTLESNNVPENLEVLLCKKCNSECCVIWESAARWLRQEGLVCAACYDPKREYPLNHNTIVDGTRIKTRCVVCGLGFCLHHCDNVEGEGCRFCRGEIEYSAADAAENFFKKFGKYPLWDPLKRTRNETAADGTTKRQQAVLGRSWR